MIDIALRHRFTGLILHKGLAEQYREHYSGRMPLIVKVNGKDNIAKISPFPPILCSVDYAVRLGADAVGYTLYVGSRTSRARWRISGGTGACPRLRAAGHRLDVPAGGICAQ